MFALIASLFFLAAAEPTPVPVKTLSDLEVPQYLKVNLGEVAEWSRALRQMELGQQRMQQGNSILNAPRVTTVGAFRKRPIKLKHGLRK
jgi:hypothetical protein